MDLEHILSHPFSFYSASEIIQALRITRQSLQHAINKGQLDYSGIVLGKYVFTGKNVRDYLLTRKGKGFKSLEEIMRYYKLPVQRNEK
jgi:hypothetical protein